MTKEEKYTTLDTDQCKWWVNTLFNIAKEKACNSHNFDDGEEIQAAQDKIIKALEQQTSDDCVSRAEVIKFVEFFNNPTFIEPMGTVRNILKDLPPVTPTHGTCKDCKHCCYITGTKNKLCEKHSCMQVSNNWYCADFKKRGSENADII